MLIRVADVDSRSPELGQGLARADHRDVRSDLGQVLAEQQLLLRRPGGEVLRDPLAKRPSQEAPGPVVPRFVGEGASIQGAAVPPPYDQVQLEVGGGDEALERVVEQIERRLGDRKSACTRSISWLNSAFAWGAWIAIVILAAILIAIGQWEAGRGPLFLAGLFPALA